MFIRLVTLLRHSEISKTFWSDLNVVLQRIGSHTFHAYTANAQCESLEAMVGHPDGDGVTN